MDNLYEQIVTPKKNWKIIAYKIFVIFVILFVFIIGSIYVGLMGSVIALALGLFAFLIAFPRLNVSYEYSLCNSILSITVIFGANKRKNIIEFNVRDAKQIAPVSSDVWAQYNLPKPYRYTSGQSNDNCYGILLELPQFVYLIIEPDETMIETIKSYTSINVAE